MELHEPPSGTATASEHRRRLLQGMGRVAASKGFVAATIADVVREAGVSKRTFYEHFDSKDACFLALYRAVSMSALKTLKESVVPGRPWQQQLELALGAYLAHMAANPDLLRTLFIEIHHLGPAGERVRRDVMNALAGFMVETLRSDAADAAVDAAMALAAVGGINELVLQSVERGQVAQLPGLTATASEVVRRLARPSVP